MAGWNQNWMQANPFAYQFNDNGDQSPAATTTTTSYLAAGLIMMSVKVEASLADGTPADAASNIRYQVFQQQQQQQQQQHVPASHAFAQPEEVHPRFDSNDRNGSSAGVQNAARVPIPPQSATPQPTTSSSTGPMSAVPVLPSRPKPGRKPIPQEDAVDRRRLQNRIAQRNFRDKRQQKLFETQLELEAKKTEYRERVNDLERKLDEQKRDAKAQKAKVDDLTRRLKETESRAQNAESKVQQNGQLYGSRASNAFSAAGMQSVTAPSLAINTNQSQYGIYGGSSVPTPPEDHTFAMERDFTKWRPGNQQSNGLRPTISNESSGMDFSTDFDLATGGGCGFCARDGSFCACKESQQAPESAPAPGTCADCQADPKKAEACRDLAKATRFASRPSTSDDPRMFDSSARAMLGSVAMAPPQRQSCSSFVDQFNQWGGGRTSSISELFGGQLHAYPSTGGGFDVDQQEAAEVLQSLSRRNTLISPQESCERSSFGDASRR